MERASAQLTPQEADELARLRAANERTMAEHRRAGIFVDGADTAKTVVMVEVLCRELCPIAELEWERRFATMLKQVKPAAARAVLLDGNGQRPPPRG